MFVSVGLGPEASIHGGNYMYNPNKAELRQKKLNQLLLEELSEIIENEMRDPRLVAVTVTRVETSRDLRHIRIHFSVRGGPQEREEALAALKGASGFLRQSLAEDLSLQYVPEISFRIDDSPLHSMRIEKLLDQIKAREDGQDSSTSGK